MDVLPVSRMPPRDDSLVCRNLPFDATLRRRFPEYPEGGGFGRKPDDRNGKEILQDVR
jgi:hypothetical protein